VPARQFPKIDKNAGFFRFGPGLQSSSLEDLLALFSVIYQRHTVKKWLPSQTG
jgi:hypothetical protein